MTMDPSTKPRLGSQLSDQREDDSVNDTRKSESEDPEEPRKKSRETLSFSQGPSQQILEDSNTVKRRSKRKREDSEEGEHVKKIKLRPRHGEECEDSSSNEKRATGKQPERPISINSKSSCFSEEKCCTWITIDDLPRDGHNFSNAVIADPNGEQGFEFERLTDSSRDSSGFSEDFSSTATDQQISSPSREGTSDELVTALKTNEQNSKVEFETKYTQEKKIGQGAYGSVFAGSRNSDDLPVAIKYIPRTNVPYTHRGKEGRIPLEVALLLSLKDVPAVITLLDWYDLGSKVVLVLERPEQCINLFYYVCCSNDGLEEHSMKIITQQLVDAFAEIHSRGVLHRDLHSHNVLIELGSTVPRVRIIDFGCGTFLKSGKNKEQVTVSQIGQVLHELLDRSPDCSVTEDFNDFLSACLDPETKSSLQGLQRHPWLNTLNQTKEDS